MDKHIISDETRMMVLCSYDEQTDKGTEVYLVFNEETFKNDKAKVRKAIESLFDPDDYDGDDLQELNTCINNLVEGNNGTFGDTYYWDYVQHIL